MQERRAEPSSDHLSDGRELSGLLHPCPTDPDCAHCGERPTPGRKAFDWSFVDGAYCISLQSRPDRAANAAAELHRVGLCRKVTFYRPTKHPARPKVGIWEAHRRVAMEALTKGSRTVLVLEDDVQFGRWVRPRTVRAVRKALSTLPAGWMIFFLGHWPLRAWFVRRNVLRSASACTHAYIASSRLLQWLRDHPFGTAPFVRLAGTGIDAAYAALPGTYAYFPMLARQSESPSDHLIDGAKRRLKKLEHLFSRWRHRERLLSRLMRPNEFVIAAFSPLFYAMDRLGRPLRARPPRLPLTDAPEERDVTGDEARGRAMSAREIG